MRSSSTWRRICISIMAKRRKKCASLFKVGKTEKQLCYLHVYKALPGQRMPCKANMTKPLILNLLQVLSPSSLLAHGARSWLSRAPQQHRLILSASRQQVRLMACSLDA